MTAAGVVTVTTTIDDPAKAHALAESAVATRLAACAQVGGPVTSVYRWQGQVEQAQEWTVTLKTTSARADALVAQLRSAHSYELPEILVAAVTGGDPDYLAWVAKETTTVSA